MGVIEIVVALLQLGVLVVGEIFAERKAARLANEEYELTKAHFEEVVQKCLGKMRDDSAKDSQQAGDVEDRIDQDLGKKP